MVSIISANSNSSSNGDPSSSSSCDGFLPFYEVPGLSSVLLAMHAVSILMLLGHTRAMAAAKTRLEHPVFAVVLQEMAVLSVCACADCSLLVAAMFVRSEMLVVAYLNVARMAMLFHPVTWAIVSLLR